MFDINECVAEDLDFIKEAGAAAVAANKATDDADDAAHVANDFATLQQVMGSLKGDGLNGVLDNQQFVSSNGSNDAFDNPCPPPDSPDAPPGNGSEEPAAGDDAPAPRLWTILRHSASAAKSTAAAMTSASAGLKNCENLQAAQQQLADAATLVDEAAGAPLEAVLDYLKSVSAKAGGAQASAMNASIDAKLIEDIDQGIDSENDLDEVLLFQASDAAEEQFRKSCGQFSGPFDATMEAHFFAKDGGEWWTYSTQVKGTLQLNYALADSGTSIPISGAFTGDATQFTYSTDPYAHLSLTKGATVRKEETAPVPDPEGIATSFDIPVSGTLNGQTLALTLGAARHDFDPGYVVGSTNAIIVSPLALIPVRNHYTMPFKDVHFILNHFFPGTPWQVLTAGTGREIVAQSVQSRPMSSNKADYTLDVHVCDPACTGTP
jgi:hypothetical protein